MVHDDQLNEDVPEGAAVFPLIPEELGINPILLGYLHAVVFLLGSNEEVFHPEAAEEALQYMVTYLQRLKGPQLERIQEDIQSLLAFARKDQWPKQDIEFLQTVLTDFGVGGKA